MAKYQVVCVSVDTKGHYNHTTIKEVEAENDTDALRITALKDAHDLYFGSMLCNWKLLTEKDWLKIQRHAAEAIGGWEQTKADILSECDRQQRHQNAADPAGDFLQTKSIFIKDDENTMTYTVRADEQTK
jgi:glycogen debranching enzyme